MRLVGADDGGFALKADKGAEPVRQDIAETVPPAGAVGLAGEGEKAADLLGRGDSVGSEKFLDIWNLQPDFGLLHAPYGGVRHIEGAPCLLIPRVEPPPDRGQVRWMSGPAGD